MINFTYSYTVLHTGVKNQRMVSSLLRSRPSYLFLNANMERHEPSPTVWWILEALTERLSESDPCCP